MDPNKEMPSGTNAPNNNSAKRQKVSADHLYANDPDQRSSCVDPLDEIIINLTDRCIPEILAKANQAAAEQQAATKNAAKNDENIAAAKAPGGSDKITKMEVDKEPKKENEELTDDMLVEMRLRTTETFDPSFEDDFPDHG